MREIDLKISQQLLYVMSITDNLSVLQWKEMLVDDLYCSAVKIALKMDRKFVLKEILMRYDIISRLIIC